MLLFVWVPVLTLATFKARIDEGSGGCPKYCKQVNNEPLGMFLQFTMVLWLSVPGLLAILRAFTVVRDSRP